eukprot:snap_masked-scaffold_18-processed-gene-1.38-mRNA-1 protein AED:1.00 eAED:1.00 QI:0/-1/0/0/-1/1/1/0/266
MTGVQSTQEDGVDHHDMKKGTTAFLQSVIDLCIYLNTLLDLEYWIFKVHQKFQKQVFFDIAPDIEGNSPEGTWSNYMHRNGNVAVSSIERGSFMLRPRDEILYTTLVETSSPTIVPASSTPPTVTPAPTMVPTESPFVCTDHLPLGVNNPDTGKPVECVDVVQFCTEEEVVERCAVTCGRCVPETSISTSSPTELPERSSAGADSDLKVKNALTLAIVVLVAVVIVLGGGVQIYWSSYQSRQVLKTTGEEECKSVKATVLGEKVEI